MSLCIVHGIGFDVPEVLFGDDSREDLAMGFYLFLFLLFEVLNGFKLH
jgi:hypothetical protein